MPVANSKVGKAPHRNSKEAPPLDADAAATYSQRQLLRMDADFVDAVERAISLGLERRPNNESARL